MSDVMIEAQGLTKNYGSGTALRNANFKVNRGEVVGFLGPNGAGKTTTMKILTCFIAPSEGTARVAGSDIFEDAIAGAEINFFTGLSKSTSPKGWSATKHNSPQFRITTSIG